LPSHFPGEDRRDYARAGASFLLLYFVCCLALEEGGWEARRADREGWTSEDTGERKIKWLDFRTTGMDTGAPVSLPRPLEIPEGKGGYGRQTRADATIGGMREGG